MTNIICDLFTHLPLHENAHYPMRGVTLEQVDAVATELADVAERVFNRPVDSDRVFIAVDGDRLTFHVLGRHKDDNDA